MQPVVHTSNINLQSNEMSAIDGNARSKQTTSMNERMSTSLLDGFASDIENARNLRLRREMELQSSEGVWFEMLVSAIKGSKDMHLIIYIQEVMAETKYSVEHKVTDTLEALRQNPLHSEFIRVRVKPKARYPSELNFRQRRVRAVRQIVMLLRGLILGEQCFEDLHGPSAPLDDDGRSIVSSVLVSKSQKQVVKSLHAVSSLMVTPI